MLDLDIDGSVNFKDLASEFGGCFLYIQNPYDISGLDSQFEEIIHEGKGLNSIPKKILKKIDAGTQFERKHRTSVSNNGCVTDRSTRYSKKERYSTQASGGEKSSLRYNEVKSGEKYTPLRSALNNRLELENTSKFTPRTQGRKERLSYGEQFKKPSSPDHMYSKSFAQKYEIELGHKRKLREYNKKKVVRAAPNSKKDHYLTPRRNDQSNKLSALIARRKSKSPGASHMPRLDLNSINIPT